MKTQIIFTHIAFSFCLIDMCSIEIVNFVVQKVVNEGNPCVEESHVLCTNECYLSRSFLLWILNCNKIIVV